MQLLDRYLNAARFWLPRNRQDDIVAELSDDLRSQIEEKETALGRSLDEAEVADILKRCGHPLAVAGRYLENQYLIGPALFPLYRFAVKAVLFWVLVPVFALIVAPLVAFTAARPGDALLHVFWSFSSTAFYQVGIMTVVFALLEERHIRPWFLERWDPRKLPALRVRQPRRGRGSAVVELVFTVMFTAWWLNVLWTGKFLAYGPEGVVIALAPVWTAYRVPLTLLGLALIALAAFELMGLKGTRSYALTRLALSLGSVIVYGLLLRATTLVVLTLPSLTAAEHATLTHAAATGARICLLGAVVDAVIRGGLAVRSQVGVTGRPPL